MRLARRTVAEESWPISGAALRRARRSHRPASTLGPPHVHVQRARPEAAVADQLRDAGRHAVQRERVDNGHHHRRAAAGRAFRRALGWHPAAEAEELCNGRRGSRRGRLGRGQAGSMRPRRGSIHRLTRVAARAERRSARGGAGVRGRGGRRGARSGRARACSRGGHPQTASPSEASRGVGGARARQCVWDVRSGSNPLSSRTAMNEELHVQD